MTTNENRQKLTKNAVDKATPAATGDVWLWDTEVKGFALRVWPSGRKVFMFVYRPKDSGRAGGKRKVTIGASGSVTAEQARREAKKLAGHVAAKGNPAEERKNEKHRLASERRLNDVLDAWVIDRTPRTKAASLKERGRLLDKHVRPTLGGKKLNSIAQADVERLHRSLVKTPVLANRVVETLRAVFQWVKVDPNPARGIEAYPEAPKERFLSHEEFARLGAALTLAETVGVPIPEASKQRKGGMSKARKAKQTGRKRAPYNRTATAPALHVASPDVVAAIRFALLSGMREKEVLALEWSMLDLEHGLVTLPESKTGKSHRPLGAAAIALLDERPRRGRFVFPSPLNRADRPEKPLREIRRSWDAIRAHAGLADLRFHDLRHSHASVSVGGLGLSLHITAALLGHARTETAQRYAHLSNDPVKRAADAVSGRVDALLNASVAPEPTPGVSSDIRTLKLA